MEDIGWELQRLMFWDLFKCSDRITLSTLNQVESKFLLYSFDDILSFVSKEGETLKACQSPPCILLASTKDETSFSKEYIQTKRRKLELELNQQNHFDYQAIAHRSLELGKQLFKNILSPEDFHQLDSIECNKVCPTGEEWSIPYETGFAAGGLEIAYPDANQFSPAHINLSIQNGYTNSDRIYIDYCYWCHIAILHEFVHCLQTVCSLTDDSGWILEHDASRLQGILPALITEQLGYPKSFIFQVALHHMRVIDIIQVGNPMDDMEEKYTLWRDSFGVIAPSSDDSFTYNNNNVRHTIYLKQRVGIEALLSHNGANFSDIASFMFSRKGNLLDPNQPKPPKILQITNSSYLESLLQPTPVEMFQNLFEKHYLQMKDR